MNNVANLLIYQFRSDLPTSEEPNIEMTRSQDSLSCYLVGLEFEPSAILILESVLMANFHLTPQITANQATLVPS